VTFLTAEATDVPTCGAGDVFAALACLERDLDTLASVDPRELSGTTAMDVAARLAAAVARATGVRLGLLPVIEDSGAWALDRSKSMPWALARREDAAVGTIRAEMTLAERLDRWLPLTAAALRTGTLSVDKAKLIAKLAPTSTARQDALADPDGGEAFLLAKAAELDCYLLTRVLTAWCYRVDPDADDEKYKDHAHRYHFEVADTLDGSHVRGFLSPETTEALRTALRAIIGVPTATDPRTTGQRQAEALGVLARFFLDSGTCGAGAKVRPHLSITVPYDTLLRAAHQAGVDPATFTETGQPLPRTVLDRLACDCELTRIVFGPDSTVLDVGRTKRIVTPLQRRAVIARDKTCRGPDCHAPPRYCEVHHLIPWSQGGPTSLTNSGLFCWADHDRIHTHYLTVTHEHGLWVFTDPDGTVTATKHDDE
jgi:nucleotide-binding universal stress UspA family protein